MTLSAETHHCAHLTSLLVVAGFSGQFSASFLCARHRAARLNEDNNKKYLALQH